MPLFFRLDQRLSNNSSFLLLPLKNCRICSPMLVQNAKISHYGSAFGWIGKIRAPLLQKLLILTTGCHFYVDLDKFSWSNLNFSNFFSISHGRNMCLTRHFQWPVAENGTEGRFTSIKVFCPKLNRKSFFWV